MEKEMNKPLERKIQRLCRKFADDLQKIFDTEMDDDTYENSDAIQNAVSAQGWAEDAADATCAGYESRQ